MSLGSGKSPKEAASPSESWGGGGIESTLSDGTSSACVGPTDLVECGVEFDGDDDDESVRVRDGVRVRCIGLRKETFRILSNGLGYVTEFTSSLRSSEDVTYLWL